MEFQISVLWNRLRAALATQAPLRLNQLAEPASEALLASFEAEIGSPLPADVRASWLCHDGQRLEHEDLFLFGDFPYFSVAESRAERSMRLELVESTQLEDWRAWAFLVKEEIGSISGPVKAFDQSPLWLPIGSMNGDVFRFVDLDPAPGGSIGQIIEVDPENVSWRVLAPSFAAFFECFVVAVERKKLDWDDFDGGSGALFPEPRQKIPDYLKTALQATKPPKAKPLTQRLDTMKLDERAQFDGSVCALQGGDGALTLELKATQTAESIVARTDAKTIGVAQITMRAGGVFDVRCEHPKAGGKPVFFVEKFQRVR